MPNVPSTTVSEQMEGVCWCDNVLNNFLEDIGQLRGTNYSTQVCANIGILSVPLV